MVSSLDLVALGHLLEIVHLQTQPCLEVIDQPNHQGQLTGHFRLVNHLVAVVLLNRALTKVQFLAFLKDVR